MVKIGCFVLSNGCGIVMVDAVDFVHFPPTRFDTSYGCAVSPIVNGSTVAQTGLLPVVDMVLSNSEVVVDIDGMLLLEIVCASRRNTDEAILVENISFYFMSCNAVIFCRERY